MVNVKHVNNMKKFNKKPFLNVRERIWFVIALLIVSASSLFAQDPLAVSIVTIFDGEIKICNETEYLQVNIDVYNNTGYALEAPELIINMPEGLEYADREAGLDAPTQLEGELRFTMPDFYQGEVTRTLTFYLKGNCDFLAYLTAGNGEVDESLPKIFPSLQYTIGVTTYEVEDEGGSETFNVLFPSLNLQVNGDDTPQTPVRMDKHVFRHFTVENMGIESLTRLWIKVQLNSGLTIHNLFITDGQNPEVTLSTLSPISYSDNIAIYEVTDFTLIGDNDPYFTASDGAITFKDEVEMVSFRDSASTFYYAEWGCDDASCNYSDAEASGVSYVLSEIPNPVVTNTGSNGTYTLTTSGGALFDVKIKINLNELMTYPSQIYKLKHSNGSEITLNPTFIKTEGGLNIYEIDLNDKYSYDPDGEGVGLDDVDGDTYYDDLPPGAQLTYLSPLDFTYSGQYNLELCDGDFDEARVKIREQNFIAQKWDNSFIDEVIFDNHYYRFGSNRHSKIVGDGDIDGMPERLKFTNENVWVTASSAELRGLLTQVDDYFMANIILPNEAYIVENISYNIAGTNYFLTESEIIRNNNIVSFEIDQTNPGELIIGFDLSKDCSVILPEDPIYSEIVVDMLYHFDRQSADAYSKAICKSKDIIQHCPLPPGVASTDFKVRRATFGWKPPTSGYQFEYKYKDLFGTGSEPPTVDRLDKNTPGIRLDLALIGDDVLMEIPGKVPTSAGTLGDIYLEIEYTAPEVADIFEDKQVDLEIGGTKYENIPVTINTIISGNSVIKDYYIPFGESGIPDLSADDEFNILVLTKMKGYTLPRDEEFNFSSIKGSYYEDDGGGNKINQSIPYYDEFHIFNNRMIVNYAKNYIGCNTAFLVLNCYHHVENAYNCITSGEVFPNEYRPLVFLQDLQITMPEGLLVDETMPILLRKDQYYTVPPEDYTIDGNLLTITGNEDWPVLLEVNNNPPWTRTYIVAYVKKDEENYVPDPAERTFRQEINIIENPYLNEQDHTVKHISDWDALILGASERMSFYADNIQEGYQNEVNWQLKLCNNTSTGSWVQPPINNWIAIELQDEDNSTEITDVLMNGTPVSGTTFYNPETVGDPNSRMKGVYIPVGTVNNMTCKTVEVSALITDCEDDVSQDIDMYSSWSCTAPIPLQWDRSYNDFYDQEKSLLSNLLTINYRSSDLAMTVYKLSDPYSQLCSSTQFEASMIAIQPGGVYDIGLYCLVPEHVFMDISTLQYEYDGYTGAISSDYVTPVDGGYKIDVSALIDGPLEGVSTEDNFIKIRASFINECGFDPGIPIRFYTDAKTNCGGRPASLITQEPKIHLENFILDEIAVDLTATTVPTCNSNVQLDVTLTNNGDYNTVSDKLYLVVPPEFTYLGPVSTTVTELSRLVEGENTLIVFDLGSGFTIEPGNSETYSFDLLLGSETSDPDHIRFYAKTSMEGEVACASTGSSCMVEGTTGEKYYDYPSGDIFPRIGIKSLVDLPACLETEISLTAEVTGKYTRDEYTYQWEPDRSDNYLLQLTLTQSQLVRLTVTAPDGCATRAFRFIPIIPRLNRIKINEINVDLDCDAIPEVASLSVPHSLNYDYQWIQDGEEIAGETSYLYTTTTPGWYSVYVTNGECSKVIDPVSVLNEEVFDADFTVEPSYTEVYSTVTVSLNDMESTYDYYVNWGDGETTVLEDESASHSYRLPGMYTISMNKRSQGTCSEVSAQEDVTIVRSLCSSVIPVDRDGQFARDVLSGEIVYVFDNCPGSVDMVCYAGHGEQPVFDKAVKASAQIFSDDWIFTDSKYEKDNVYFPAASNDYDKGKLGNWRVKSSYVYNTELDDQVPFDPADLEHKTYNSGSFTLEKFDWQNPDNNNSNRWIGSSVIDFYSPNGIPLEERNALGMNSAVKYGYHDALPVITAQNAAHNSIYFESFEVMYKNGTTFENLYYSSEEMKQTDEISHAGMYSLEFLASDDRMRLAKMDYPSNMYPDGMIVTFWANTTGSKETLLSSITMDISTSFGTVTRTRDIEILATNGEWMLCQAYFEDFGSLGRSSYVNLIMQYTSDERLFIDDVKIQPKNAETACYVYDPVTLKPMVIFDSQHFGTFYQYDYEQRLVRKLIETEKGVRTVIETYYNRPGSEPTE